MKRNPVLIGLFLASLFGASARAQDDSTGVVDESEVEDRVQDAIDQAADDVANDLDVDSVTDSELGGIDSEDLSSEVDVANSFDSQDALASLELDVKQVPTRRRQARYVTQLLFNVFPAKRASAALAIARNLDVLGVPALTVALRDPSSKVRAAAANALGKLGDFEALGALKRAMPRENDPKVARVMDKAMGNIEDRVFSGPGAGEPVTLTCSDGRKFVLLRKVSRGFCPYDGTPWTLQ